jgi:hypothetical protein
VFAVLRHVTEREQPREANAVAIHVARVLTSRTCSWAGWGGPTKFSDRLVHEFASLNLARTSPALPDYGSMPLPRFLQKLSSIKCGTRQYKNVRPSQTVTMVQPLFVPVPTTP